MTGDLEQPHANREVRDFLTAPPAVARRMFHLDPYTAAAITTACTLHGWTPQALAAHASVDIHHYAGAGNGGDLMKWRIRNATPRQPQEQ